MFVTVASFDHVLELGQAAKVPVPLAGLVDQLVKGINQERLKTLLSRACHRGNVWLVMLSEPTEGTEP